MGWKKHFKYIPKHCKTEMKPTDRQGDLWVFQCKKCGYEKTYVEK